MQFDFHVTLGMMFTSTHTCLIAKWSHSSKNHLVKTLHIGPFIVSSRHFKRLMGTNKTIFHILTTTKKSECQMCGHFCWLKRNKILSLDTVVIIGECVYEVSFRNGSWDAWSEWHRQVLGRALTCKVTNNFICGERGWIFVWLGLIKVVLNQIIVMWKTAHLVFHFVS